jgi:hypothetical protein
MKSIPNQGGSRLQRGRRRQRIWPGWPVLGVLVFAGLVILGIVLSQSAVPDLSAEAPEYEKVQAVQGNMPFQILIPAFMPKEFDRAGVNIQVDQSGPGGEPMVQLTYRTIQGATLFLRQWVPVHPDKEILGASRPIQTKWGRGWLLTQGDTLAALWVDIGPLRTSIYSSDVQLISKELLLQMAETLGPASNQQVFSFSVEKTFIQELAPPPPEEIKVNDQGVQELTLVVTPGGYSPLRFAVRQGVPVRLLFRQLGQVGCGNELIFPANPESPSSLTLASEHDKQVLEFTPRHVGDFEFFCSHRMYRGVMTVRE